MTIRRNESFRRPLNVADIRGRARPNLGPQGRERLNHLTRGPVARQIDLDNQFRLRDRGDLARRMGLHKLDSTRDLARHLDRRDGRHGRDFHGGRHFHRGPISPIYAKHHFSYHGPWPKYYGNFYGYHKHHSFWYPRWSPWVSWSWFYHCGPAWDPRPYWVRPWYYAAAPTWVYWQTPVWEPLPVVVSGTWVDVPEVQVQPSELDLQLLAVRFVDPGHPEEKLGPRYRVWFRNNSTVAINQPFDVFLLASNDGKLAENLPRAGVQVPTIEAGQTQAVDIRLPFEVEQMGRDEQGQPVPFSNLHVLIDANRQIEELDEANNGTTLATDLVLPVDPAVFEAQPKQVEAGAEVLLAGEGLGPEPGRVLVHLGGIEMEAQIAGWYDLGVRLKMPALPLAAATDAELIVIRRDGVAANPLPISVTPKVAAEGAPLAPANPAPVAPAQAAPAAAGPELAPPAQAAPEPVAPPAAEPVLP